MQLDWKKMPGAKGEDLLQILTCINCLMYLIFEQLRAGYEDMEVLILYLWQIDLYMYLIFEQMKAGYEDL